MPTATVSQETVKKDLRTCPGGFVELRALPYGKLLSRREMASKMSMGTATGPQDRRRRGQDDSRLDIEVIQEAVRYYEFRECVVNHNLTDSNDRPLDFNSQMDFQMLDPKIGQEIEGYIDELNQEEGEEVSEDFTSAATDSSPGAKRNSTTKKQ